MTKITLMNNDQRIFCGLYESVLYNSDTDYYLAQYLAEDNFDGIDLNNAEVDYDFSEFKQVAGEACVDSLEKELYSHDVITNMDYAGMSSPRYYNYGTDKVLIDKQEYRAKKWSYYALIPFENLKSAILKRN